MKSLVTFTMLSCLTIGVHAQDFGLSFSYFIPKNGYFSTPISPFSLRGVGFNLNRFISVESGASLYRMAGLTIKDLPFESKEPFTGPNFTLLVPVELVFTLQGPGVTVDLKGGVFGFHGFGQRLNYGNIDRAIRQYENWEVANSTFTFANKPGWGYHAGSELTIAVTQQFAISLEANYLMGSSSFALSGSYTGGSTALETRQAEYPDARIDLTGLEISLGVVMSSGNTRRRQNRRR
jgi:hypothetical protein